jgi:hypothetical protein
VEDFYITENNEAKAPTDLFSLTRRKYNLGSNMLAKTHTKKGKRTRERERESTCFFFLAKELYSLIYYERKILSLNKQACSYLLLSSSTEPN